MPRGRTLLALLAALVLGACSRETPAPTPMTSRPVPGDHGDTSDDLHLAQAIRQALRTDPAIPGLSSAIGISVSSGTVRLTGTVPLASDKAEIGVQARWLAGIDRVQNSIVIATASGR